MTGTLLSLLSIGNLLAGLLAGALVGKMGMKAKRPAADHRLCGGLRPDGPDRPAHSAGAGLLHCGHCQGQCPEHLHHPCQRQLCRPHPGHEHHARLLRLRCPALPLSDLCRGQGQHHAGRAGTGSAGSGALAGIPVHPHGRPCQGQKAHRLELFALRAGSGCSPACCSARTPPSRALWAGWSPTSRAAASLRVRWRPTPSP